MMVDLSLHAKARVEMSSSKGNQAKWPGGIFVAKFVVDKTQQV